MALIASISGVRFTIDEPIETIAQGYATAFAKGRRGLIVVGRDSRPSGVKIKKKVMAALKKAGCQRLDLGMVTTPTLTMALVKLKARGGVMITASHNPAQWNGLKFFDKDGLYLRKIPR